MQRWCPEAARVWLAASTLAVAGATAAPLKAEPWSDLGDVEPPVRRAAGDTGIELSAEYRSRAIHLTSYDLDGHRAGWVDQRLRTHLSLDRDETVRVVLDVDALEGILWGASTTTTALEESAPGFGRVGLVYGGGEPTHPDSYDLGVEEGDTARLRHAYGEVWLPIGRLRVGRQPTVEGTTITQAEGQSRANRFGMADAGDSVDRVQLTWRPLQPLETDAQREDRGFSVSPHYDLPNQGTQQLGADDLHRAGIDLRYLAPLPTLEQLYDATARSSVAWSPNSDTVVGNLSTVLQATVYELGVGLEVAYVTGRTREQSLALSALTGELASPQRIQQFGARFVARWDEPVWSAYLEVDYASGDADPSLDSRLTRFSFAPDANVGLLLFDHVLAFQTARSAAAAAASAPTTLPLPPISASTNRGVLADRMATDGAFTNAVAFFPQFDLRPVDTVVVRTGILLAWTPDGLLDPLASLRSRALGGGDVNYNGGAPGFMYGTEIDGRITWRYRQHFYADLEGAYLVPGDALRDAEGNAKAASLVQGRLTFAF